MEYAIDDKALRLRMADLNRARRHTERQLRSAPSIDRLAAPAALGGLSADEQDDAAESLRSVQMKERDRIQNERIEAENEEALSESASFSAQGSSPASTMKKGLRYLALMLIPGGELVAVFTEKGFRRAFAILKLMLYFLPIIAALAILVIVLAKLSTLIGILARALLFLGENPPLGP